ncbi:unnamed protein product [Mycena citricolor]|uniref:Ricin B lectin domain-containing protein n=1 Tax=Mycena citricolor TaxID=2018698 RepID=A0AAD2H6K7_9AGAR|nr:unnamed protein product [Mycena citricolor]
MLFQIVFGALFLLRGTHGVFIEGAGNINGAPGCIAATSNSDGAALVLETCDTTNNPANENWELGFFTKFDAGPQPIKVFGDKCIDVTDGVVANGTKLQIWTCVDGSANQQWISVKDSTLRLNGTNMCIDWTGGSTTPGTPLQLWTCAFRNTNQIWGGQAESRASGSILATVISHSPTDNVAHCIAAESNADGAAVVIAGCVQVSITDQLPNGNNTWTAPTAGFTGPITTYDNKCLDVTDGSAANGTKLQIWTCVPGSKNQMFTNNGNQLVWAGTNQCVDLTDGNLEGFNQLQMWGCNPISGDNNNQVWIVTGTDL